MSEIISFIWEKVKLKLKTPTTKEFNSRWVKGIIVKSKVFKAITGGFFVCSQGEERILENNTKAKS